MSAPELTGWERLRHGGLLLDPPRLSQVAAQSQPPRLQSFYQEELRRRLTSVPGTSAEISDFVSFVLQKVCRFSNDGEAWQRGSNVGPEWGRPMVTGDSAKPRHLWRGRDGAILPVFIDTEGRVGIGRGRRVVSHAIQWLRAGTERLALVTNGQQFRLVFVGLDFDAWCEWDTELWLDEGALSPQVDALRALLSPELWTPPAKGEHSPLVSAILESRKGQAELSAVLGERVREAVELLVQAHGRVLESSLSDVNPADIYRAAVRMVMRMVVVLFAESRELLPRDHPLYNRAYGLTGLLEDLEKVAARGGSRLARTHTAWPRVLALFRLVYLGSHHPELAVPAYGGELFAPGDPAASDGLTRALSVFERAAFERELLPDKEVLQLLDRITRTRVRVRQGRGATWIPAPVDFSDLSTEYIGILYEGLLDFELKTAPAGDPVVFLAVGNQPALPLSRLESMDDKALGSLLEKMKDTSKADDGGGEAGDEDKAEVDDDRDDDHDDGVLHDDDAEDVEVPVGAFDDDAAPEDARYATRTRAEAWARRAVEVGKLVRKPSGTLTPEKRARYEEGVGRKARQLVLKVMLPGEWYLVRWGGTRKGAGTFYTRPGLAVPTVHRTLRPLAYDPPVRDGGEPDRTAPAPEWTPKPPEDILALKVCDPACGSGTFPVAALRFLTDALYASLHHHQRLTDAGDRTIVQLLTGGPAVTPGQAGAEPLGRELLPCRPDEAHFEPRLKAVLRRYVVERCIYGVDLDPLAVELCRLALWIETMDRQLPFSFLDHKVKCGNSLVGAWFDQFQHYPVMAWKNREGGDKSHTNGVHFQKDARTKAFKAFVKNRLTPDLRQFLAGKTLFSEDLQQQASTVHDNALAVLARMHELPVHDSAEHARMYRDEVVGSPAYRSLKSAMDLWCACWFWPADDLAHAPLPSTVASPSDDTRAIAVRVSEGKCFFHWELEFPDVFRAAGAGFDAILGNPPWDVAKPSSKEFFSNIDPLYRSYGKQEALRYQSEYFARENVERDWLDYTADFKAQSNVMGYAGFAFGDPAEGGPPSDRFAIGRRQQSLALHDRWRDVRRKARGFTDVEHPFRHQGSADINLYKAFLEQAHALLRVGGRLGFIVPSGLYSDHGTGDLRRLFVDRCQWEWLFGLENRDRIFDIHRSFKFSVAIIQKGGVSDAIRCAFMRRDLGDWERSAGVFIYTTRQLRAFSPTSLCPLEFASPRDIAVLETMASVGVPLGEPAPSGWGAMFGREFHATEDSHLFSRVDKWSARGFSPTRYGRWTNGSSVAVPVYQGAMIHQFDPHSSAFAGGSGHAVQWEPLDWCHKRFSPQWLMGSSDVESPLDDVRLLFRYIANPTNTRTMLAALAPSFPAVHTVGIVKQQHGASDAVLCGVLNSVAFDWQLRARFGGSGGAGALDNSKLRESIAPFPGRWEEGISKAVFALNCGSEVFAAYWLTSGHRSWQSVPWRRLWAVTTAERLRSRSVFDSILAKLFGLLSDDLSWILRDCDYSAQQLRQHPTRSALDAKGFWRVDKDKDPELRHTVLALIAFHDLEQKIEECGGDRDKGIQAFLSQNDGEGWMLPETLRLADYGLGHDDRAKEYQPVASRLGPRFFDWQLTQSAEESWRECHLHARNLLGEEGYRPLMEGQRQDTATAGVVDRNGKADKDLLHGGRLFD